RDAGDRGRRERRVDLALRHDLTGLPEQRPTVVERRDATEDALTVVVLDVVLVDGVLGFLRDRGAEVADRRRLAHRSTVTCSANRHSCFSSAYASSSVSGWPLPT